MNRSRWSGSGRVAGGPEGRHPSEGCRPAALAVVLLLVAGVFPTAGFSTVPASTPLSPTTDRPLWLYSYGETITAFLVPRPLAQALERSHPARADSLLALQFSEVRAAADPETLTLPEPAFSFPLPGTGTSLLLPTPSDPTLYVATRSGLAQVALSPKPVFRMVLPDLDIAMAQRATDGTIFLLMRTWDPVLEQHQRTPTPLLSFKPGTSTAPDTVAILPPGSCAIYLAPGDSLIWVPRIYGRNIQRLLRRGERWESTEIHLSTLGKPQNEHLWRPWMWFVPQTGDPRIFDQRKGARPRLLTIDPVGTVEQLYGWNHGLQAINGSMAWKAGVVAINSRVEVSVVKMATREEIYLPCPEMTAAVALSDDGFWLGLARSPFGMERTRIILGRTFSNRIATTLVDGVVSGLRITRGE